MKILKKCLKILRGEKMRKFLDSSMEEVQFWWILGTLVLVFRIFISQLQQSLPEGNIGRQVLEEIRQRFYGSLKIIIIGFSIIGTLGSILFLKSLLKGNGGGEIC